MAALQVILGHMIEHYDLPGNEKLLHASYFLRGVPIFFVISGFLMWFSIGRSNNYREYLKKRFWRIYPELWIVVLVEVIVLVLLYKGWEIKSLLAFVLAQATILQFWTPGSLRGYGVGTPNGALWTIGVMVQFYIIAYSFFKLMKNRKLITWIIGFFISFVVSWGGLYIFHNVLGIEVIAKLYDQIFVKYFWLFYIGMFIAEYKDKLLPVLSRFWYILLAVAFVFFWTEWDLYAGYWLGWSVLLTAGLIGFAYRYPKLSISTDISYGLFLYHMIVVNVFVNFGWSGKWIYALITVLIAVLLAYLSSVTIGKISADKKNQALSRS